MRLKGLTLLTPSGFEQFTCHTKCPEVEQWSGQSGLLTVSFQEHRLNLL